MLLPTIKLGDYNVSRLIIGGNPFSGNSHVSKELDDEMMDYYSTQNIKNALFKCEESGINTMQLRGDKHIFRILREYRSEGGKMQFICMTASELASFDVNVREICNNGAFAIYHHGSITDDLFKKGEYAELERRLKVIRKSGKVVGLGTHMPEVVEYAEEHKWDVDFYMTCVYNLSKVDRVSGSVSGKANTGERFDDEDRAVMYKTIKAVSKPCLAFKILGASRRCSSQEMIEQSFEEAFSNIKNTDAVVVGMFQKYKDQIEDNCRIVRRITAG